MPTAAFANAIGKNAATVVAVAASSGTINSLPALMAASDLSMPFLMYPDVDSTITIPLSTSIPKAMIYPAREICCNGRPIKSITTKVIKKALGIKVAMMIPSRQPSNSIMINPTERTA